MSFLNIDKKSLQPSEASSKVSAEDFKQMYPGIRQERFLDIASDLSMERLANIYGSASTGLLYDLYKFYRTMLGLDSRLSGMFKTRQQATAHAEYTITCADKQNPQAKAAKELLEKNIDNLNMQTIRETLHYGRAFGVCMLEKVWYKQDGMLHIKKLPLIDFSRYEMLTNISPESPNYGRLLLRFNNQTYFAEGISKSKIVIATSAEQPGFYDQHAYLRPVARWFVIKSFAVQSWAQAAETYGFPVVIAKVPESEYKRHKQTIKRMLQLVGPNRYGIFFKTMDYEVHSAATSLNVNVWSDLIDLCNTEMAIGILSQNLSSEVKGGSYAATESMLEVLGYTLQDDITWTDEIIQQQICNDIVLKNFPNLPRHLYPTYSSGYKNKVDLERLASGLQGMAKLTEIPVSYIHEVSHIPQATDGEPTIGGYQRNIFDPLETN